jgi:hypothetical protein
MTWWAWLLICWGVALLAALAFVRGAALAGHAYDVRMRGYVELDDNDCVWFVFPEQPDADGNPRRMHWGEAEGTNEDLRQVALYGRRRAANASIMSPMAATTVHSQHAVSAVVVHAVSPSHSHPPTR